MNVAHISCICLTVEGKPRKNLNQEIDPTGNQTQAHCVRSNDVAPKVQWGKPAKITLLLDYEASLRRKTCPWAENSDDDCESVNCHLTEGFLFMVSTNR